MVTAVSALQDSYNGAALIVVKFMKEELGRILFSSLSCSCLSWLGSLSELNFSVRPDSTGLCDGAAHSGDYFSLIFPPKGI